MKNLTRLEVKDLLKSIEGTWAEYQPYRHRVPFVGLADNVMEKVVIAMKQLDAMMQEREGIGKC